MYITHLNYCIEIGLNRFLKILIMYRLSFKPDIINMDKLNLFQYNIQFMNYLVVPGDDYYVLRNNEILNYEKELITETEKYKIFKINYHVCSSQIPVKYKIDSNIILKFLITADHILCIRGFIDPLVYNAELSCDKLIKQIKITEIFCEMEKCDTFQDNLFSRIFN